MSFLDDVKTDFKDWPDAEYWINLAEEIDAEEDAAEERENAEGGSCPGDPSRSNQCSGSAKQSSSATEG